MKYSEHFKSFIKQKNNRIHFLLKYLSLITSFQVNTIRLYEITTYSSVSFISTTWTEFVRPDRGTCKYTHTCEQHIPTIQIRIHSIQHDFILNKYTHERREDKRKWIKKYAREDMRFVSNTRGSSLMCTEIIFTEWNMLPEIATIRPLPDTEAIQFLSRGYIWENIYTKQFAHTNWLIITEYSIRGKMAYWWRRTK